MGLNRASLAAAVFSTAIATVSFAELIGVGDELRSPVIVFDSQGTTTYDAASDLFSVNAAPIAIRFTPAEPPRTVDPTGEPPMEDVAINILLDENGDLIGGVPGDDLIVIGEIDSDGDGSPDFLGVLLTGEIKAFGFAGPGGPTNDTPTDLYDFVFETTGGAMAAMFSGGDIGVVLVSESSSFDGNFTASFGGLAKGNIGLVSAVCGDGECDSAGGEDPCTCPEDCGRPVCGNGVCECEETLGNCCQDCGCPEPLCSTCNTATGACDSNCGNGTCEPNCGENCETCAEDCPTTCGDGVCECGENEDNCCEDCGCPACQSCVDGACQSDCGDGACDPACEDCNSCPTDCAPTCGDGTCECGEDCNNCAEDCQDCGDGCCDADAGENCDTCPTDCPPTCGDGVCECGETNCDCPADCPSVCDDGCCADDEDSCSCQVDCPGPCEDCEECDGKVTTLTLRYNGSIQNAEITIDAKRGPSTDPVFDEAVNPGDTFTIVGPQSGNPGFLGTLGTEIRIFVNGELNTTIHTSCSVPIGPGLVSGDFEVVSGESKNGGLLCPPDDGQPDCGDGNLDDGEECDDGNNEDGDGCSADCRNETDDCDCEGKVSLLTLRYNGSVENAQITVEAKRGPSTDPVFDATVNPGEEFTLTGPPTGNGGFAGTLGTEIDIFVNGELNTTIHTSCSQPIGPGLVSGDFEVVSGESKNGGVLCPLDQTANSALTSETGTPPTLGSGANPGTSPKSLLDSGCGAIGFLPLMLCTFMMICVRRRRS